MTTDKNHKNCTYTKKITHKTNEKLPFTAHTKLKNGIYTYSFDSIQHRNDVLGILSNYKILKKEYDYLRIKHPNPIKKVEFHKSNLKGSLGTDKEL